MGLQLVLSPQERRRKEARENAKRAGSGASASTEGGTDASDGKNKKPRVDYHSRALEVVDPNAPQLKIPLPFTLKKQLVEVHMGGAVVGS
jgi:hypothetical protein